MYEELRKRADAAAQVLREKYFDRSRSELGVYYYQTGQIDKALDVLRVDEPESNRSVRDMKFGRAMFCEQKRYDDMLALSDGLWPLAALILEKDMDDVVDLCRKEVDEASGPSLGTTWGLLALCAAGGRAEAMSRWQGTLHDGTDLRWNHEFALKIFTGQWSLKEALGASGSSRMRQCIVYFAFAMKALHVDRDRAAAVHHFQKCADLKLIGNPDYYWVKAYLVHLEDPAWPRWLPQAGSE